MLNWALLLLRLCAGVVFIAHGSQAALGLFGGPGINGFSQMLAGLGFKPALAWAYLGAYVELVGGLCLLSGIFVKGASLLLFIFMVVAAVKVHWTKGFFIQNGGFEYTFVLACVLIVIILLGAGKFSLGNKI